MGAESARITAQDFLTPPELEAWKLAANGAGRIGGLRLELIGAEAGTRLGACYQQIPLRVLPPFRFGGDRPSLLYLLNPTAGLMDGDAHLVQLDARAHSRAIVVGQSATRIHPGLRGFSTQQWLVRVDAGAVLVVLPGPAIPFAGSRYYQRVRIDLAPGAALVWGDIWLAGRYARGAVSEQFQFTTVLQDFQVQRFGKPVYRDRFCWQGPWDAETARWHFGHHPACGSLFATGPVEETMLPATGSLVSACFPTGGGDTCIRWSGSSEETTSALVRAALRIAAHRAGQAPATSWLLPTHDLAPNHWFSPM